MKGIVHPEMQITSWFMHPQAILGVYDFLISDVYYYFIIINAVQFMISKFITNGN